MLTRHMSSFHYAGPDDDRAFHLAFDKDRADERKTWMLEFRYERPHGRSPDWRPEHVLTATATTQRRRGRSHASRARGAVERVGGAAGRAPAQASPEASTAYSTFFDTDFIQFSIADTVRSIPSVVDGLKPSQRKVLFACLKRNLRTEMKVAQLSGMCSSAPPRLAFVSRSGRAADRAGAHVPLAPTYAARVRGAGQCLPPRRGEPERHDRQHGPGLRRLQQRAAPGTQRAVWHAAAKWCEIARRPGGFGRRAWLTRAQTDLSVARTDTGKDAASARYIFTRLSPMAFALFPRVDEGLLEHAEEDGQVAPRLADCHGGVPRPLGP